MSSIIISCHVAALHNSRRIPLFYLKKSENTKCLILKRHFANVSSSNSQVVQAAAVRRSKAQASANDYYRRKRESSWWFQLFGRWQQQRSSGKKKAFHQLSQQDANVQLAWYAAAAVVGALGATYAAVPLYKVFCQTTGFGGTTQRVRILGSDQQDSSDDRPVVERFMSQLIASIFPKGSSSSSSSGGGVRVHTWTDEDAAARLATLRPVENADLVTIRFDTTVGDVLPWSFVPVCQDVKVVPGETALSFFRVTNHSDKAITGVATYNVHPPKVGVYFQKIQCFCFEEQRLLPGETVDMPVFFFIDPDIINDPQVSYVRSVTLSYTFFQTDEEDDDEDDDDEDDDVEGVVEIKA